MNTRARRLSLGLLMLLLGACGQPGQAVGFEEPSDPLLATEAETTEQPMTESPPAEVYTPTAEEEAEQREFEQVDEADPSLGPIYAEIFPAYAFNSLAEMMATAQVVVEGRLTGSSPGRSNGLHQYQNFDLDVTEVWSGGVQESDTIIIERIHSSVPTGRPIVLYDSVDLHVGDEGLFFLFLWEGTPEEGGPVAPDSPGPYFAMSEQTLFVYDDDRVAEDPRTDPLSESIQGLPVEEFHELVDQAAAQAANGQVQPAERLGG